MMKRIKSLSLIIVITIFIFNSTLFLNKSIAQDNSGLTFELVFSPKVHSKAITGRVFVIISRNNDTEPRFQANTIGVPIWGINVENLKPGEPSIIDNTLNGYPLDSIDDIPPGDYFIQGFINIYSTFHRADGYIVQLHQDEGEGQKWNISPGNLYSNVKKVHIDPRLKNTISITIDNIIPPIKAPEETNWVKYLKLPSELISRFWGRQMYLGATILLPKGYYDNPDIYYPVNYVQGHFSMYPPYNFENGIPIYTEWVSDDFPRMIAVVFQHPNPYYDDSYCVNSANLGPYGDAITRELIPYIESKFRIIRKPYARILCGIGTGGWASLALQIFYPDLFGGAFALCPDPVDFRFFQLINIYEDKNAYYRTHKWLKVERPNERTSYGHILSTIRDANYSELIIGDKSRSGRQWAAWDAVFGPVGIDGYPKPLWNKITGEIDPSVAEYWKENYDFRYYLEKNWEKFGPKLAGKLHIYVGSMDTYYLNNAILLLEEFLEKTKNPYYAGNIEYGEGQPFCWGPREIELIKIMAKHIKKNAPAGGDLTELNY